MPMKENIQKAGERARAVNHAVMMIPKVFFPLIAVPSTLMKKESNSLDEWLYQPNSESHLPAAA